MLWYFNSLEIIEKFTEQMMHLRGESDLFNSNNEKCGRVIIDMPVAFVENNGITLFGSDTVVNKQPKNREERRKLKYRKS